MGALGIGPGAQGYMQMMAANAMSDAAKQGGNTGGMMGAGMGMGMGMGMGGMMAGAMHPGMMGGHPGMMQQAPAMAPPPMPAAAAFHVAINGAQQGPFDVNMLRQMAGQGQVNPQSMVWKQGMPSWAPAGQVPELAQIFQAAAPPPLPAGGPPPMPPSA